ncbi:unnamed protein product [Rotaria sp. Silwood1]|nr:unnamed protein product [Rotaria sp. Silwood1]CAF4973839.1 unnamed protein product [Rotaria sp. Silwood1]
MSQNQNTIDESELTITPADPLLLIPSISKENLANEMKLINRFSGICYSLIASFLFIASTFTIKQLGIDLLDALLLRFILQTIITFSFALYKHYSLLSGTVREIFLQIICAIMGSAGSFLLFLAMRYIELSDVNTLFYTRVVWTVVLSIIVYRERPSIGILIALPLTFLGVIFVTQPTFLFSSINSSMNNINYKFRIIGYIISIICALTAALNVLIYKQIISTSKNIKASVLNFQFSFSISMFLILNQFYKIFHLKIITSFNYFISWRYIASSIVCFVIIISNILIQKAIKREHPTVFSLLGSADIFFALMFQYIFSSVRSNLYTLLGSALIISSVVLIGISKIFNERNLQDKLKQKEKEYLDNENEIC